MTHSPHGLRKASDFFPVPVHVDPASGTRRVEAAALQVPVCRVADARIAGSRRARRLQEVRWAVARLAFYAYIGFSMLSITGGFITAPLMTWLFFNDWRWWRYWGRAWHLFPHAWHLAFQMLRGESRFMLSVPLTSAPQSVPDTGRVEMSPAWQHGSGCGDCQRCCEVLSLRCPVLDDATGFCTGYNSFYWRYFNCGRYPSRAAEISYYGCDKWKMK
jgi:hypothetical protein